MPLEGETKTYCGIAKTHKLMVAFNSYIEAEDPVSLKYLLAWKENRSDMCTDPLTVGKTLVMKHISAALFSMVKSFFL